MKRIKKSYAMLLILMGCILYGLFQTQDVKAASSYTNAKQFYESTADQDYTSTYKGSIYVGTKAKQASSSSNLKYYTLGYDVTLSAGGYSLTFTVKRNTSDSPSGSMVDVSKVVEGGYVYNLYKISMESIRSLAYAKNSVNAKAIFSYNIINVVMDSVMTTKRGNSYNGSISENGNGGANVSGTVYWFINDSHIQSMRNIFVGHTFNGYFDIQTEIYNYPLLVSYNANGGTVNTSGYSTVSNVLYYNGSRYTDTYHLYDQINLFNFSTLGLTKKGYHAESGKEWIYKYRNLVLSQDTLYTSQYIEPDIGTASRSMGITVTANWVPNTYTVKYHANGGEGSVTSQTFTYDKEASLRNNTFTKRGYKLIKGSEWNTKQDGSGTNYSSEEVVLNLVSENKGALTLYANWEPCEYEISTFKDGGIGGDDIFYELYDSKFFFLTNKLLPISKIENPSKLGYIFKGYYKDFGGVGDKIIDDDGNILVNYNYFDKDTLIYSKWLAKEYTVMFDKQGGEPSVGTDFAKVHYNEEYPFATASVKPGYSFKGYYNDKKCVRELYYTESMAPLKIHSVDSDITLYAKWVDDVKPATSISVSTSNWTNIKEGVRVNANAYDFGSGLDYAELYCDGDLVEMKGNLGGARSINFEHFHKNEGAYRYKIVAYDLEGNMSESYKYVLYDIKSPVGSGSTPDKYLYTLENSSLTVENLTNFSISIYATDYIYD